MDALLLAAGLGSRLKPYTNSWPKCLMPICGVPLLEYWISDLIRAGASRIFVNTHHHSQIVHEFLARPRFSGVVEILYEERLKGTAGTLRDLLKHLPKQESFWLVHADNWCGFDLSLMQKAHGQNRASGAMATMMTFVSEDPQSCGIVSLDDRGFVSEIFEKCEDPPGNLANAAVYILEPDVLAQTVANEGAFDFTGEILPDFVGSIATIHNDRTHRDIGKIGSLLKAQSDPPKDLIWDNDDAWLKDFRRGEIVSLIKAEQDSFLSLA